jgi:hypothetical protein
MGVSGDKNLRVPAVVPFFPRSFVCISWVFLILLQGIPRGSVGINPLVRAIDSHRGPGTKMVIPASGSSHLGQQGLSAGT